LGFSYFLLAIGVVLVLAATLFGVYYYRKYTSLLRSASDTTQWESLQNLLHIERITRYFATSMSGKYTPEDVLWDVTNNLISQMGFVDCMIYLWNDDHTKMIQKAGFGPKGSVEDIQNSPFDVVVDQGVVGAVMRLKEAIRISDTRKDSRYRADEMVRLSELCVPIMLNGELIGIIDSEHPEVNWYNETHVYILNTLASMIATKLEAIWKQQELEKQRLSLYQMKQEKADAELATLRNQMNPHFIFNTLNSINSYVIKNEPKTASLYLAKFSNLMRLILDNSQSNFIPLQKELDTLELYVFMERLRFSNAFDFSIDMCMEINAEAVEVPPLILQPFIENAIWHGLLHKEEKGQVTICLDVLEQDWLLVQIEDNGIGRVKAMEYQSQSVRKKKSLGLDITAKRLAMISTESHPENYVEIIDLYDSQGIARGTKVVLKIPI
jgi:two-component system LytT family sensor kinase